MKRVFVRVSEKVVTRILKFIIGVLQRTLLFLSLIIAVLCSVLFVYGLYKHSLFYCVFSAVGAPVFVYINKQC